MMVMIIMIITIIDIIIIIIIEKVMIIYNMNEDDKKQIKTILIKLNMMMIKIDKDHTY